MRTESEMKAPILRFAHEHDDVRAVVLSGPRANPKAVPDRLPDYDITYLGADIAQYRANPRIPAYFGDIMIVQMPDDMGESVSEKVSYA